MQKNTARAAVTQLDGEATAAGDLTQFNGHATVTHKQLRTK